MLEANLLPTFLQFNFNSHSGDFYLMPFLVNYLILLIYTGQLFFSFNNTLIRREVEEKQRVLIVLILCNFKA